MIPRPGRSARAALTGRSSSGYKAQVTGNDDGIVLDYGVEYGAAPDGPQLVPAITLVARRTGRMPARSPPTAVTASPPSNATCTN